MLLNEPESKWLFWNVPYRILEEENQQKNYGGTDEHRESIALSDKLEDTEKYIVSNGELVNAGDNDAVNEATTEARPHGANGDVKKTTEVLDFRKQRKASVTNILENGHVVAKLSSPP